MGLMTRRHGHLERRTEVPANVSEVRGRLVLVRDPQPRARVWPDSFADDTCDELCGAVDEAVTLEDALAGAVRTLCGRMRWNAGRAAYRGADPVWYVDSFATVRRLAHEGVLRDRIIAWNEPWTESRSSDLLRYVFPIDWSADAWLEFYSTDGSQPYANALDDIARALVPASLFLPRKPSERTQRTIP
jgi:hypothetical protein